MTLLEEVRERRREASFLAALFFGAAVLQGQPESPKFTFSVNGPCGLVIEGPPGADYDDGTGGAGLFYEDTPGHTLEVLLTMANHTARDVIGWQWSLGAEGALTIVGTSGAGTVNCWLGEGPLCLYQGGASPYSELLTYEGEVFALGETAFALESLTPQKGTIIVGKVRVFARFPETPGTSVFGRLAWLPDPFYPHDTDHSNPIEDAVFFRDPMEISTIDCEVEFRARAREPPCTPLDVPPIAPTAPGMRRPGFGLPRELVSLNLPPYYGYGLLAIAADDINGDGTLDLVASGQADPAGQLVVILGRGRGEFAPARNFPAPERPLALIAADLDGDGALDLATANAGSDDFTLFRGAGDGGFGAARRLLRGDGPSGIAATDLDGDGRLDLAVTLCDSRKVAVLIAEGGGAFRAPSLYQVSEPCPASPVAADFDGDGVLDLAVTSRFGVKVLFGTGGGAFAEPQAVFNDQSSKLTAVDLNRDGAVDLVTSSGCVLLGAGDGSFRPSHLPGAEGTSWVAADDFDGDGAIDLATIAHVWRGRGDGSFMRWQTLGAPASYSAAVICLGGGHQGLALAGPNGISLVLLRGDGLFESIVLPRAAAGKWPAALAAADYNGDGAPDLATANLYSDDVSVLLAGDDGIPRDGVPHGVGHEPCAVAAADLDADGDMDLSVANRGSNSVSVLLGADDGAFIATASLPVGVSPRALIAGDFNGDGSGDLATADFHSSRVSVLLGQGDGSFAPAAGALYGSSPFALLAEDFNDDGIPDLVVAHPREVVVALGRGDGSFAGEDCRYLDQGFSSMTAGDFDADGIADLAGATADSRALMILRGEGNGGLEAEMALPAGGDFTPPGFQTFEGLSTLTRADFDGDGALDLAATAPRGRLLIYAGRGDGGFHVAQVYDASLTSSLGFEPPVRTTLLAFDAGGDGLMDLALTQLQGTRRLPGAVLFIRNHLTDCNRNQVPDKVEIAEDPSRDTNRDGIPDDCQGPLFRRGDADHDGQSRLSDAVFVIAYMFLGGDGPACRAAADANADQRLDIADAVYLLDYLFRGGRPPPAPGPAPLPCGPAPPSDVRLELDCQSYERCSG